jgi:S1-C subfamily serine protease
MNIPDGQGGLVVGQVVASDPAGVAGLKAGDVIIKVGSYQISSEADLAVALIKQSAGQKVSVEFYRDGKKSSVDVTLGTAPA